MSWYKTGTITVTNGSAAINGSGSLWVDAGTLNPGDAIKLPDGKDYEVLSIQSNTQLTLASNYLGSNASAQAYAIVPLGLLPSSLALAVKTALTAATNAISNAVRYDINTQGLSGTQQGYARTNIAALGSTNPTINGMTGDGSAWTIGTNQFVKDSSGNIGLGTASPSTFGGLVAYGKNIVRVITGLGTSGTPVETPIIEGSYYGTGGEKAGLYSLNAWNSVSGHGLRFKTWTAGGAALTAMDIASDGSISFPVGQLKFPATQNASSDANTLDDYEEGTWTPTLTAGGGGSVTHTEQYGHYTKIGRTVTVNASIAYSKNTASGNMGLSGLPFAGGNLTGLYQVAAISIDQMTAQIYTPVIQIQANTTTGVFLCNGGGTADQAFITWAMRNSSAGYIRFAITYQT